MKRNIYLTGCIILIATAFFITTLAVTSVSAPIGADSYFHLTIASYYAKGQFAEATNFIMTNNLFYYPPAYHFLITPFFFTENPYTYALIFEALFLPLTFALIIILMIKHASAKAAFITGICLLGSLAFVDGAMQLRPESLDLLLYPLMIMAALSAKKKSFIIMAATTVYGHGIAALSNIYGVALKLYKDNKQWRKTILAGLATITPILIISAIYIQGAFTKWFTPGGANNSNPQQTLFWTNPLWTPLYSGLTLIGFAYLLKPIYNRIRHHTWKISPFESLLCWGIIASTIMIPFWADRWLQYITIPLSCLIGLNLQNTKGWKQIPLYFALTAVAAGYITYWIGVSLLHGWAMQS